MPGLASSPPHWLHRIHSPFGDQDPVPEPAGWALLGLGLAGLALVTSCTGESAETGSAVRAEERLNQYATVRLTTDTATPPHHIRWIDGERLFVRGADGPALVAQRHAK